VEDLKYSKQCKVCNQVKQLESFYKHHSSLDGRQGMCKECRKEDMRKRFQLSMQDPEFREKRRLKAERERFVIAMKEVRRIRKNAKARERYKLKIKNENTIIKTS